MPKIVEYKKGDVIYREGSFEMAMYFIKKGSVSLFANYGLESQELLVGEREGEYLGHLDLVEAIPRSATAVADDSVVLERIEGDEFGSYLSSRPDEYKVILTQMSRRLRDIGNELHEVYRTIDEYIGDDKTKHDSSFFNRLSRFVRWGKR
ncbi:MAG: Crp/Fnr family transcriptional regulator [Candidatus Ornithospirochaeta sp.]